MMEYVLVTLMMVSPGYYQFEVMSEFHTMADCERSRIRAVENGTTKIVSLVCAKKEFN